MSRQKTPIAQRNPKRRAAGLVTLERMGRSYYRHIGSLGQATLRAIFAEDEHLEREYWAMIHSEGGHASQAALRARGIHRRPPQQLNEQWAQACAERVALMRELRAQGWEWKR